MSSGVWGAVILAAGSGVVGAVAQLAGLPAAWLVGPMFFAVFVALVMPERRPAVPLWVRRASQAVVGCVLASNFSPQILPLVAGEWRAVALAVAGTLILSLTSAAILARLTPIDGRTAGLGVLPGAASGMLSMSDELGADVRLVAVMQYGRIILVIATAAVVASLAPAQSAEAAGVVPVDAGRELLLQSPALVYGITALVAVVGAVVGVRSGLPAGSLVGPLVLGIVLDQAGILHASVPVGVSELAFALIGIYAGLLFDRDSLRQAWELLPFMFASTLGLMAACTGLGLLFAALTGTDYLTAYLATTPGAIDSVAIMAVDSGADSSLVLAIQMLRIFGVIAAGSLLGRIWNSY